MQSIYKNIVRWARYNHCRLCSYCLASIGYRINPCLIALMSARIKNHPESRLEQLFIEISLMFVYFS
jgi:hypothetical protein